MRKCKAPKDHPLENNTVIYPAPAVKKCTNLIRSLSENYIPGAMLYGSQRVGKTFALKYFVKHALKSYGISAPVFMHCAHDETSAELLFLQSLLTSTGHSLDLPSRLGPARNRLIEHLECQAINAHDNRVVLLIDDAQWLTANEFHRLMWIHNELDQKGIFLIVVLVGQPELRAKATEFVNSPEILARFMNERAIVAGIQRSSELSVIYKAMDSNFEYPVGSGISYTAAYVPLAFKSGFELSAHANQIFDAFNRRSVDVRGKKLNQLTLQTARRFTLELLRLLSKHDHTGLTLSSDLIELSIDRSGFRSLEAYSQVSQQPR